MGDHLRSPLEILEQAEADTADKKELTVEELENILSLGWLTFTRGQSPSSAEVQIFDSFSGTMRTGPEILGFQSGFSKDGFRRQYHKNNGVIVFYDKYNSFNVAPLTPEREQKLIDLGFKQKEMPVWFSNGTVPGDLELRKKWEEMRTAARDEYRKNNQEREAA